MRKVKVVKQKYEKVIAMNKESVPESACASIQAELNHYDFGPQAGAVKRIQPSMARAFERAELEILSDCGHGILIERTSECVESVSGFISGL